MIKELVYKNRSYRRFYQNKKIGMETLVELVDLTRHSACGGNLQSLKYILSCDDKFQILLVVALGQPKETIRVEYIESGGDIKYWRDESNVHHVPKRPLKEIIARKY
jgi:hypothetical protein